MRSLIALILFCLAAWFGYRDLQTSQGDELALTPAISVWEQMSPGTLNTWLPRLEQSELPFLPELVELVLSWPMALILLGAGIFFFMIRRRPEPPEPMV